MRIFWYKSIFFVNWNSFCTVERLFPCGSIIVTEGTVLYEIIVLWGVWGLKSTYASILDTVGCRVHGHPQPPKAHQCCLTLHSPHTSCDVRAHHTSIRSRYVQAHADNKSLPPFIESTRLPVTLPRWWLISSVILLYLLGVLLCVFLLHLYSCTSDLWQQNQSSEHLH